MAYRATAATEARKQALKQRLLEAALEIVSREGFAGLSISAVASECDVATGTLYRYFHNKAALCAALFAAASQREVEQVAKASTRHRSAADNLASAIATFAHRALRNPRLAWALIAEPADPLVEAARLSYRQAYARVFTELVREGMRQGCFHCNHPELVAAALVGALAESLLGPLSPANPSPQHQESILEIQQFALRALGCPVIPQPGTPQPGTSQPDGEHHEPT
ncbi:TetR/AcrR family transcriptional regulator [Aestuariirhabdus litorea]|uniref:TetR/AcrR family transcriptional regulator n=1 Tax=Aestuariirhabdus litorea TaxID=2528527 RepID=A0A3P3VM72_9GAMM|nr:TetR/AcrR family transcriptional regulator [Aestuariirhabdus litorea]RRJ83437.1 TetR/AcrR family transcriptional regulator [Aestuariirhabdus litorea]RWW93599.1 TetR family transcriptional regulator [Endozoicomonadaceae bacterium GTF-13]